MFLLFVTSDSQVGVLRIWNVSHTTPIDNLKLKNSGFHSLHVLSYPPKKKCKCTFDCYSLQYMQVKIIFFVNLSMVKSISEILWLLCGS